MKKFLTFLAVMLMSLTAVNAEDLYLRGGVNNWNASADYKFADNGDGTFTLDKTFDLEGQFKFADANWGSVLNFGSSEKATCSEQGVTINLVTNGDNITTDGKLSITKIVVDKNQKKATFFGTTGAASDAVYTIAGQGALVGVDWDPSATTNDMTDMEDGTYQLVKENISLAAGDYEYKAVKNHAWGVWECPSSGNNTLTISEAGTYTVTFTLTPATSTLEANAVKSGEPQPVDVTYYLVGYINGANVGCDEDYESLPEQYKFVNGSLTATFTETSYVFAKTGDNNHWFLPESYVAPAAQVTVTLAEGKSEKVGVNANVEVTFTLTENADGTLTLSYKEATTPVETKYYITGNAALVGEEKAWQADAIEMVDYTHTFPMLAAGEYQLKVTDGTWEHAWGYDNLSPTVAVEGLYTDVDGNICFTVYTPNDVTVTFAQGYVVVTGDFKNPQPAEEGFGIIVNGTEKIKGQKNEEQVEFLEYMIEANLTAGATFQLYDFANDAAWTEANIDEASTKNVTINTDNLYEAAADGKYTIYLKMYGPDNNQVYIAFDGDEPTPVVDKYYITGNEALVAEKAWDAQAIEMIDSAYIFTALAAGDYEMKVTNGTWEQSWGSADLSEECSAGVGDKDGNIHFVVETPNDVTVSIANGKVTVIGIFKQDGPTPEEGFGIIVNGTEKIKGQKNEEQVEFLEYMIEANLTAGATFQLYDFANDAAWTEANIDEASTPNVTINNDVYTVSATGKYTIYLKMYGPENNQVYIAFTSDPTGLIEIMRNAKDGKFIINGKMIIRRNGALYTIQGARL